VNQTNLDWYAARLAVAIFDTNAEYRMGIHNLREELKHVPGGKDLTMRYGSGGRTQIYTVGEEELEFSGVQSVTAADIEAALESKKKVFLNTPSAPLKRSQA
jgi:hypothetical protein